ncbi:MAG TPA: tetratricopeptide repeat protein [Planctomycetaceae bacterium]|nr:tetratricopeptide repeat protein [Planctomycetaceae bacterium]
MSPVVRARLIQTVAVVALIAAAGFGLSRLFRNPVAELTRSAAPRPGSPLAADGPRAVRPPRPSEAYVGSAVCAECHDDIHDSYRAHPMGLSLAHVDHAPPLEDYEEQTSFDTPPHSRWDLRLRYYVERSAEGVFHHEVVVDGDGEVVFDQSVPVHYAVGSGQRGRSYLTNRDGLLFMSPITWYSQKSRWDLSPGYELENVGFERSIPGGCVSCHAGRSVPAGPQPHRFEPVPFVEESIGCERCHGPGEQHVALHRRGATAGDIDSIVNPADLEPRLRDSVCFQCHLQGAQRLPRYGRSEFDFRPGDDLNDIWTVFLRGTGVSEDQTTEAVSQVEQMLASTCYRESQGRLGCISCHDPHALPAPEKRIEFYRSRCLECHDAGGTECGLPLARRTEVSADDSCIQCHMPPIPANDVPHTSQTDHRVLRTSGASDETQATAVASSRMRIFGEEAGRTPERELERARGLLLVIQTQRSKGWVVLAADAVPRLEKWLAVAPDDELALEALGTAYWLIRDLDAAYQTWERALVLNPQNDGVLRRLTVVCNENGRIPEGAEFARRLVALDPWNHMYFGRLAHMLGQLERYDEGIRAAHQALELKPANAGIHGWLGHAYQIVGDRERSHYHRSMFEKLGSKKRP